MTDQEEIGEGRYRCGYADGFNAGLSELRRQLQNSMYLDKVYSRCQTFRNEMEMGWAFGDCSKVVMPPQMPIEEDK